MSRHPIRELLLYWAYPELLEIADMFQKSVAQGGQGTLDLADVERIIDSAPTGRASNAFYFLGRFLELRGAKQDAQKYLRRCATSPVTKKSKYTCMLACSLLRKQGLKIGKTRDTELEK